MIINQEIIDKGAEINELQYQKMIIYRKNVNITYELSLEINEIDSKIKEILETINKEDRDDFIRYFQGNTLEFVKNKENENGK